MDAAILFAPVGDLVPQALRHTAKGGTVVCAGIHMSNIPEFPYSILWGERCVRSIANLTRRDGEEFFAVAPRAGVRTEVECFPLESANEALHSAASWPDPWCRRSRCRPGHVSETVAQLRIDAVLGVVATEVAHTPAR
jgi:threonine dehydrogenase-like Zn-dependent dehydrogenase